mgnify:CR=1 FL=1
MNKEITIHDAQTGETVVREMTDDEQVAYEAGKQPNPYEDDVR